MAFTPEAALLTMLTGAKYILIAGLVCLRFFPPRTLFLLHS